MSPIPLEDEYERGLAAGRLEARLDDHTRRLDGINGSVATTGDQLRQLTAQISELVAAVSAMGKSVAAGEEAREKYVPIVEALHRRRLGWLKWWHVVGGVVLIGLPQTLNLILRFAGVG